MEEEKSTPKTKAKAVFKPLGNTQDLQKRILLKMQLNREIVQNFNSIESPSYSQPTPTDISIGEQNSEEARLPKYEKVKLKPIHFSQNFPNIKTITEQTDIQEEFSEDDLDNNPNENSPLYSPFHTPMVSPMETNEKNTPIKEYINVSLHIDTLTSQQEKSLLKPRSFFPLSKKEKDVSFLDFLKDDTDIPKDRKTESQKSISHSLKSTENIDSPVQFVNTSTPIIFKSYFEENEHPAPDVFWDDEILSKLSEEFLNVIYKDEIDIDEIQIMNLLYEEEYYTLNELYEEEIIIYNQLYDKEVIFENPLVEIRDKDPIKEFNISIERIRIGIIREKIPPYIGSFTGDRFLNYLIISSQSQLTRDEGLLFAQHLMDKYVFKNVNLSNKFDPSTNSYYKFAEEFESGFPHKFKDYKPIENQYYVLRDIDLLFKHLVEKFSPRPTSFPFKPLLDYILIGKSPEFKELKKNLCRLYKIDVNLLSDDHKLAFFINIFNILGLCSIIGDSKRRRSVMKISIAQKNLKLIVGNYQFSPEIIEKTILNGKKHPFSFPFDPRFSFCLHKGTRSCPGLRFFNYQDLEVEMNMATYDYIKNTLIVNDEKQTVLLPVYMIRKEFGINWTEKRRFLLKFSVDVPEDYSINYQEFDYNLNQKDLQQSIQDLKLEFHEIIENPKYREFFRKFCEKEYSDENIDAWTDFINYQNTRDPLLRRKKAHEIIELYLTKGSNKELNTSEILKKKVFQICEEEDAKSVDPNYIPDYPTKLFDDIKNHIEDIMVDTFTRYKKTDYNLLAKEILESPLEILEGNPNEEEKKYQNNLVL